MNTSKFLFKKERDFSFVVHLYDGTKKEVTIKSTAEESARQVIYKEYGSVWSDGIWRKLHWSQVNRVGNKIINNPF